MTVLDSLRSSGRLIGTLMPAGGWQRRDVLTLGLSLLASSASGQETYPNKPIRLIVPFPPGGGNDVIARIVGAKLGERLGQAVVIENRGGGNGTIGLAALAQAAPDGYTLAVGAAGPLAVNPTLYDKLPYDPVRDFAPVTNMVNFPLLLVVHPGVPVKGVSDLVELARSRPDALFYASPGNGNSGHLAGELFNSMAKVRTTHVPYKGQGPALSDLLAGQVQMLYSSIPSVIQYVRQGRLNAIAVGSSQRVPSLPDVPTIAETIPGYEAYSWVGIVAPARTPKAIVTRLHDEIVQILAQKDVEDKLRGEGAIPIGDSPEHFAAYIKAEIVKWGAVVKSANIKAD